MKLMKTLRNTILALGLFASPLAFATHLVGGNLGYVYQGETAPGSQIYRYQVYMEFYLNCGPGSSFQSLYDLLGQDYGQPLTVGCYIQDPLNPNSNKAKQVDVQVFLTDSLQIEPDLPNNCTIGQGLCAVKGTFVGTMDVPLNFGGYHLYYQMCCRNLDIDNLANPNGTGIGYYAFVPPPLVNNSSPVFLGAPTPFLCTGDTTTFLNTASDPDGDQLIFSFETPYNSTNFGGGINPPPPQLPWPVPEVTYNGGFSVASPFGAGGYSFINGATGLTKYLPPNQGNYVVSVEVKEYRNGQLIGMVRRDLQLQAIPCPPNNTPQANTGQQIAYSVDAGDQLCFNLGYLDVDGDTLNLTAAGLIFDPLVTAPTATIGAPVQGVGSVGTQFCWDTDCAQGQDQPYLFSVSVTDNGCPPKTIDAVIAVTVVPFAGPQQVLGPQQVCTGQTGSSYTVAPIAGATFTWNVTGGVIASGGTGNTITVDWGSPGTGTVSVSATNGLGCVSAPLDLNVTIVPLPNADAGLDSTLCTGGSVILGGNPTGPLGSSFTWSPATGLTSTTAANPTASPTATTTYIVEVSNSGCVNRDTVTVSINVVQADAGVNASLCNGDTLQLNATGGQSYSWSPSTGLSDANIADPLAFPTTTTTYTVTATDSLGCVAEDSVTVAVNPPPFANAGPDRSVCPGASVLLNGAPTGPNGATFLWSPAAGLNDVTFGIPSASPTVLTVYTVQVTDTNGCVSTDQVTVTPLPAPTVDAGPDLSICAGDTVQINGSGATATQFQWVPWNSGLSNDTIPNPLAFPGSTTTYVLVVMDGNNCEGTDTMTVNVNALPNASAGPDAALCLGDSIQLNGSGGTNYSWSPAATLTDANAEDPIAFPTSTTIYAVVVTDANSCVASDSVTVTVNTPVNAGGDGSTTVCSNGSPFSLISILTGTPDAGGTWTPSGNYTPGQGGGTFVYVVSATAPCPNDTAVAIVIENQAPDAGLDNSVDLCTSDAPIDLFTLLGPNADAGGTWTLPGGAPFSGTFNPAVDPAGPCIYLVAGVAPCVDVTATVTVNVVAAQDPGADASVTVCGSGTAFNLTDSLGGTPVAGGSWTAPGGAAHSDVFDPAVDANGIYTYTVAGGTACEATATVTVAVQVPAANAGVDQALCIGDTVQLAATGGTTFLWSPSATLSDVNIADPLAFPLATTTYTVSVTDGLGCIALDSMVVTVNLLPVVNAGADAAICAGANANLGGTPTGPSSSTYQWSPGAGLNNSTAANPIAQPAGTTTYTVLVTDGNQCSASDSVTVTVNPLPVINAGQDTSVCLGSSVGLNAIGTGGFSWSPSTGLSATDIAGPIATPNATTTYTVTLTDANNCENTDDVVVTVLGLPNADAGADVWVCPGFDVQLNGSGGGTYGWAPSTGLNDPNSATPLASPTSTTIYLLTVTDGNGCSDTDDMTVTVNSDPPLDAGADQSICAGQQVQLGGTPTSVPGSSFAWTPSTGLDDATLANPIATPAATTLYTLTVTNDTCTSSQQVLVTLQGIAQPAFSVRLEPNCDGLRAFFTDQSSGASEWLWDFGDGTTSTEQFPQHQFAYEAPIVVTLTITDLFGCTGTITQSYPQSSFDDYTDFVMPNVFTPNGDGNNDLFTVGTHTDQQPSIVLGACANMFVFNRWGQKVFESVGGNLAWDGRTVAGVACIDGTYFYVLNVKDMEFKGTVYLTR